MTEEAATPGAASDNKAGVVLVTGASGFIGSALCAHLRERRVPFIGTVRQMAKGMPSDLQPIGELARAVLPMVGVLLAGVLLITYVPSLSLWLVRLVS